MVGPTAHHEACTCYVCESKRKPETHPVQFHAHPHKRPEVPSIITLRAYEVYCHLHGEQSAMVDKAGSDCRGGFGAGELIAFLYARTYPKEEWRERFEAALRGQQGM